MKNWKTTLGVVIGSLLVVAGLVWPETVNEEAQGVIREALNEILIGVGALIDLVTGWLAKDPD